MKRPTANQGHPDLQSPHPPGQTPPRTQSYLTDPYPSPLLRAQTPASSGPAPRSSPGLPALPTVQPLPATTTPTPAWKLPARCLPAGLPGQADACSQVRPEQVSSAALPAPPDDRVASCCVVPRQCRRSGFHCVGSGLGSRHQPPRTRTQADVLTAQMCEYTGKCQKNLTLKSIKM